MSYTLDPKSSIEALLDYVAGAAAAVQALPATAHLVEPFLVVRKDLQDARDKRDEARFAHKCASAVVRVHDALWDEAILTLSGEAFLAAGKDAKASPYAPLFGTMKASEAQELGPAKALVFGGSVVSKARELAHPRLEAATAALAKAGQDLQQAASARDTAREQAELHELRRSRLVYGVEIAVAHCEVEILQRFPGRRDLVRAMLAPEKPARVRIPGEPVAPVDRPEPVVPPVG